MIKYRRLLSGMLCLTVLFGCASTSEVEKPGSSEAIASVQENHSEQDLENQETSGQEQAPVEGMTGDKPEEVDLENIPEYSGEAYVEVNNNTPDFEEYEIQEATTSFETYSSLDSRGRCGTAEASVSQDTMPTEDRGSISSVKPTGWHNKRYDNVPGGWVYNRCHLIGFQLTGENANKENLITGTRYMNTEGMLPFENEVADYIKNKGGHVLYEVTPVYETDSDLVASGVHMQACSVEDDCQSLSFNIYAYNVQPSITIDYNTGENWEE